MENFDQIPNPDEDLKHAHAMLATMSPQELLVATHALEDILEGAVYVTNLHSHEEDELIDDDELRAAEQGRKDLTEGRTCTLDELLEIHGLTMDDLAPSRDSTELVPARKAERTAA